MGFVTRRGVSVCLNDQGITTTQAVEQRAVYSDEPEAQVGFGVTDSLENTDENIDDFLAGIKVLDFTQYLAGPA